MTAERSSEIAPDAGRLPSPLNVRGLWVSAFGALGLLAGWHAGSVAVSLALFSVFSVATIAAANRLKNFLHPLVAFPLFYYPYSTWHAYYSLINGTGELNYLSDSILYAYFGLLVFQVVGTLSLAWAREIRVRPAITHRRESLVEKMLMWVGLVVVAVSLRSIAGGGFASKRDILDAQPTLLPVMSFTLWVLTVAVLLTVVRWRFGGVRLDRMALAIGGLTVLVYLMVGERDFLFRMSACLLFLFADEKRKMHVPALLGVLAAVAVAIPWGQQFKALFLASSGGDAPGGLDLLLGEFYAASRNLYVMVSRGYEPSWSFLWNDLLRGVLPFSSEMGFMNSVAWFHNVYRYEEGIEGSSGWGFHLVAEGLLFGGVAGILVAMSLVAVVLVGFYRWRNRSEYWYVFYLLALSSAIYCIRADLANLLSMTFKIGGSAVLLVRLLSVWKNR